MPITEPGCISPVPFAMRFTFALLPLFALAACDKAAESPESQPGIATNISDQIESEKADMPPPANVAQAAEAESDSSLPQADETGQMPVAMLGRWTGMKDRCGDRSADMELNILPDRLVFHESVGTVEDVTPGDERRLSVRAAFTGEGQSWTRTLTLNPSEDGQTLTIINDGTAATRKRC